MKNPAFIENKALQERESHYLSVHVKTDAVTKSWKQSLFSFEWLRKDGTIKDMQELSETEWPKRAAIERKLENGEPIEMPVLGIGIMDNIEIGIGRAEFLTLAANGIKTIPVHIPKSHQEDFKAFLAEVK